MYTAHPDRYADLPYRRSGRSGLKLPVLSLGLWHNFGPDRPVETQRAILRRAFDLGITHFDLANNYGPPPGAAESALGEALKADFTPYRDELVISTKAGYLMWPGPYGEWGSRKSVLSSLDQSLTRMGLDHVDIFYSHRFDPETPLEETMGALHSAVQQGKALYVGVSNYSAEQTREAARILGELGTPSSSTSRATPSWTGARRTRGCWTPWTSFRSARSSTPRWSRACSPAVTSTASRRTPARRATARS